MSGSVTITARFGEGSEDLSAEILREDIRLMCRSTEKADPSEIGEDLVGPSPLTKNLRRSTPDHFCSVTYVPARRAFNIP